MDINKQIDYWKKSAKHDLDTAESLIKEKKYDDEYDFYEEVNTFSISARYPDEQFKFYKLCTEEFTVEKFNKIKEKYLWLKKKLM